MTPKDFRSVERFQRWLKARAGHLERDQTDAHFRQGQQLRRELRLSRKAQTLRLALRRPPLLCRPAMGRPRAQRSADGAAQRKWRTAAPGAGGVSGAAVWLVTLPAETWRLGSNAVRGDLLGVVEAGGVGDLGKPGKAWSRRRPHGPEEAEKLRAGFCLCPWAIACANETSRGARGVSASLSADFMSAAAH